MFATGKSKPGQVQAGTSLKKQASNNKWALTDIAQRRRVQFVAAASARKLGGARVCWAAKPRPQCRTAHPFQPLCSLTAYALREQSKKTAI